MLPATKLKGFVYATQMRRTQQLSCLGLITGWIVNRLEQLMENASRNISLASAETPAEAAAFVHLEKASMAEMQTKQYIEYLRQYHSRQPDQPQIPPSQQQRWETIGLLVAYVFVDIQRTITTLKNQLLIAQAKIPQQERACAYLGVALEMSALLSALVDNVLIFADEKALSTKEMNGNTNLLDITNPIQETVELLSAVQPPGIALRSHLAPHLPLVAANCCLLRLLTMELLINAIEATTQNGGEVQIKTGVEKISLEHTFVGSRRPPPGDYVSFTVRDTGLGLDMETLSCILLPNFSTKEGRSGSGLTVVADIVHDCGGAMQLESQPGQGFEINLYFPTQKPISNGTQDVDITTRGGKGIVNKTVLIIEDNEPLRHTLSHVLTQAGHQVLTAADGREGITTYKKEQKNTDLVLLDMNLPDLDGAEVFQLLRDFNPELAIIVSTSIEETEVARTLGNLGAVSILRKPYDFSSLLQKFYTFFT